MMAKTEAVQTPSVQVPQKPVMVDEVAAYARSGCAQCHGRGKFPGRTPQNVPMEVPCECARKRFIKQNRERLVLDGERRLCWGDPIRVGLGCGDEKKPDEAKGEGT